jgi:molecular chaperone GrpE
MRKRKDVPREIPITFSGAGADDELELRDDSGTADNEELFENELEVSTEETDSRETDPAPSGDDPAQGVDLEVSELNRQVDALSKERASLFDQLLRRQAEFENYRKRADRERQDLYQRARAEVLIELLPVLDNFERALVSLERSGGDADALRHGVELIHKQLKDALTKLGVQPLETVGQTFDPHIHEAVTIEPTDEHKENTIIEEFERGYKMGDRLLRPAKVKVAATPDR